MTPEILTTWADKIDRRIGRRDLGGAGEGRERMIVTEREVDAALRFALRSGLDTAKLAKELDLKESDIYNRIHRARERAREAEHLARGHVATT